MLAVAQLRRQLPCLDELLGHLRRDITAENPLDAASLGLGGGIRANHVARAVDRQRRYARHQPDHHALDYADRNAEEVGIEDYRKDLLARRRSRQIPVTDDALHARP